MAPSKKEEQKWQAEDDARTMQRMGEIMADPKRHDRAKSKMEEMMSEMEKSKKMMEMMSKASMSYDKTDSMMKKEK